MHSLRNFTLAVLVAAIPVVAQPVAPADLKPSVVNGLHNFGQVNDHIFRGAQPSSAGFSQLAKMGIKTVVDLRETGSRSVSEQKMVEADGMKYISIPLNGYGAPSNETVLKLIGFLDDKSAGPVFVHCRRGADRTGTILACYRIAHDHWENAKALAEAKTFGMSFTERAMQAFIVSFKAPEIAAAASAGVQQ
jgi:tyrosine-protein phosphatase SIW14